MKKWRLTFVSTNCRKEVAYTKTRTYKTKRNAELAMSKQIYDMFLIGYDNFEVVRKGKNEIEVIRHMFRGYNITYLWTIEEL